MHHRPVAAANRRREPGRFEVGILEEILGCVDDPDRQSPPLSLDKKLVPGKAAGDEHQGVAGRPEDGLGLHVGSQIRHADAAFVNADLQEHRLRELVERSELVQPIDDRPVALNGGGRKPGVDRVPVLVERHRGRGDPMAGVTTGLSLHGFLGDQPVIGRRFGGYVDRGVHGHVDVLARAPAQTMDDGHQDGRHGVDPAVCRAWLPAPRTGGRV